MGERGRVNAQRDRRTYQEKNESGAEEASVSSNPDDTNGDARVKRDEELVKERTNEIDRSPDGDHRRRAIISKVERYLSPTRKPASI
jgi:hypothetical protein